MSGSRCIHPIDQQIIDSVYPEEVATSRPSWPVLCPSELLGKDIPERRWCVPGWFPDGYVSLLSGDGGTGKSLLAMQIATCAATGSAFLGMEMAPRKVLYLACEDDLDEMHRRQADINASLGLDWPDLEGNLFWKVVVGEETMLMGPDKKSQRLGTTKLYSDLRHHCRENGIQLIIVDTLADTFGGLEIDRQQVTRFVRSLQAIARECDGAVILVSHPSVAGIRDNTGISGNTAWRNAARSVVQIRRPTGDEATGPNARDMRIIERLKGNYAPTDPPLTVRYFAGAFMLDGDPQQSAGPLDIYATEVKVEKALQAALDAGRQPSPAKNSPDYAAKMLMSYPETSGLTLKAIEATINRMLTGGRLRVAKIGRPSHPRLVLMLASAPLQPGAHASATSDLLGDQS